MYALCALFSLLSRIPSTRASRSLTDMKRDNIPPLLLASFSPSSGFHSELRLSVCHTFLVSTLQTRSWSAPFKHDYERLKIQQQHEWKNFTFHLHEKSSPAIIETQRWWFAREHTDRTTSWCAVVAREGGESRGRERHTKTIFSSLYEVFTHLNT